ncbi:hypothetical protein JCM8547_000399 [Rhodosporidiobolus lusitaniae]
MGLFSRRKTRESPPVPSPVPPSSGPISPSPYNNVQHAAPSPTESTASNWSRPKPHSARATPSTASPRLSNAFRSASSPAGAPPARPSISSALSTGPRGTNSSQDSWDDSGVPLGGSSSQTDNSPNLAPLDRCKVFGGKATSSTLSLPLFNSAGDEAAPRARQNSAMEPVQEHKSEEKGGWNRWRLGRPGKQRQGSMSSFRMFDGAGLGIGGGGGNAASDDGGFVVTSFRTISRVHEDPVANRYPSASPAATSPPLPAVPLSAPPFDSSADASQQESLRSSLDYSTTASRTSNYPRRPSLNTLSQSQSSSGWERAPSPTITANAFRLASARSQSSISLVSLSRDADPISPPSEASRPRFEPQRPSSRTSRRGSSYSDAGSPSILQPPRPSFAAQGNSSKPSLHSRTSSGASTGSCMLGANGLPVPSSPASPAQHLAGVGMANSESVASVTSYTTAPEGRSRVASPVQTRQVSPQRVPAPAATPARPEMTKRQSSSDSELRLIAAYGDSLFGSSPPCASPVDVSAPTTASSFSTPTLVSPPASTPRKASPVPSTSSTAATTPTANRLSTAPSVAVQPPTPVSVPGFSSTSRPQRTSSLPSDAVKNALQNMGVGPGVAAGAKGKARPAARTGGWASSSDEEEEERLESSDSDSDDEVPLAQIKSRSQTDLSATLRAGEDGRVRPRLSSLTPSTEVEILADASSPTKSGFALATAPTSGGAALGRKGSNRRSMSTLSFSTSLAASQPPASAAVPSSPTQSILSRPFVQPRSVSNPSTASIPFPGHHSSTPSSGVATPALSPVPSPTFRASASSRDRSSSSSISGSNTGSSSSAPLTPHDSPAASTLGLKLSPPSHSAAPSSLLSGTIAKPSVKFDPVSLASNTAAQQWNRGRRTSGVSINSLSQNQQNTPLQPPPSLLGGPQHHRSTPSLPTFATTRASNVPSAAARSSFLANGAASSRLPAGGSSLGTTPLGSRAPSTVTGGASTPGTSPSVHGAGAGIEHLSAHERMKARHRAEALQALKIGRDLNHPSGKVPEPLEEGEDDSEDDETPLASLPARGSVMGGMAGGGGGGSMLGGMSGMGMNPMAMGMGMGGAYSPLAMAPPGVDPYLYASLPPDQKMSLHQRAQQMMAMMQQAAVQAHAESVIGGDGASMLNGGGGSQLRGSTSMDTLGGISDGRAGYGHSPSMQFGMLGQAGDPYGTFPRHSHLPAFAPSFAMSQPFFQPQPQQFAPAGMYGMPAYAGSAIGFGGGAPGSMLGVPTGKQQQQQQQQQRRAAGRASSTIGMPQRR